MEAGEGEDLNLEADYFAHRCVLLEGKIQDMVKKFSSEEISAVFSKIKQELAGSGVKGSDGK